MTARAYAVPASMALARVADAVTGSASLRVELIAEEHRLVLHSISGPAVDVRVYLGAASGEYIVEFVRVGMEAFEFRRLFERVAVCMGAMARRVAGPWCVRRRARARARCACVWAPSGMA